MSFKSLEQTVKCRSSGMNVFSTEFYLKFWESLGQELVDSLNYALEYEELFLKEVG